MSTVSAFIGTSGKVIFFRFNEGTPADIWTGQASDPTYRIGDGPSIPLVGRTAYPITSGVGPPYVSYPLDVKIEPADTVTYSAPAGWVSWGTSETAPAATDAPVTNQSGQVMFPLPLPHTLQLGMNIAGPHPTQIVHVLRNLIGHTNGGGGVVSSDANFNPTAISGNAWWNTNNQQTSNGIDARGTGGVEGVYTVTWRDYSAGRDKLAWIEAHDPAQTIVTEVGSKATLETTGTYTKYRRRFNLAFNPTRVVDYLGFNTFFNSVDVQSKYLEVVGPWNDPDSTDIIDGYVKNVLAGVSCLRFVNQSGEGINSNAATFDDCRQAGDLSTGLYRMREAQLVRVEPIPATNVIRWNGETFTVSRTIGDAPLVPSFFVGLLCTTAAPHGFYTFQNVDLSQIYNNGYSKPTDSTDHCGVQVNGIDGPIWMPFHQENGVTLYVIDDTHFLCYPGYIVNTLGVADPIGVQTFDTSNGRSTISVYVRRIGTIAYEDQIQMGGEMDPPASVRLHFSECMTDQGVFDAATAILARYQSLPPERRPPSIEFALADEIWNFAWAAYGRMKTLSFFVGRDVVFGATLQAGTYLAGRLGAVFKGVFDAAGLGDVVKRVLEFQRVGDIEMSYAAAHGITFDVGGPSSYLFCPYPYGSWSPYTDVAQLHDLWKWTMHYIFVGHQDAMRSYRDLYMPGMIIEAYEGGEDQYSPGPFSATEMLDWYYHPENYGTNLEIFRCAERAGFSRVNLYSFQAGLRSDAGTMWQHSMNNAQVPGLGIDPPNLTVATKGPTDNLDLRNQNPKLKAVGDWVGNVTPSPTPTPTPTPTLRRIFVDADRLSVILS